MFDELKDSFGEILESGHSGVLLALAQTCKRLTARQNKFIQVVFLFKKIFSSTKSNFSI